MVWYNSKGIPVRNQARYIEKTTLVRVPVSVKELLEQERNKLQRDSWKYVSIGDVIRSLLKNE